MFTFAIFKKIKNNEIILKVDIAKANENKILDIKWFSKFLCSASTSLTEKEQIK